MVSIKGKGTDKGKVHLYSTRCCIYNLSSAVVTDRAGVQPRPQP